MNGKKFRHKKTSYGVSISENKSEKEKPMIQTSIIALFISLWLISPENTFAQTVAARQKTQELVASLSKTKYKHKVKGNFCFFSFGLGRYGT